MFHPIFLKKMLTLPAALLLGLALAVPALAADADADANRMFVEAVQLNNRANTTYDAKESVRLLRNADQLLKKIVARYPQSAIAVQLTTRQMIGDFDVVEFEEKVRALACERNNNVQDFLSGYGIIQTGPLTEACFLYRIDNLPEPVEQPITQARADWLSVAVAYDAYDQHDRARSLILPFMAVLRKTGIGTVNPESYGLLARALVMTGASEQAQQVAERIGDCSGRLSYMLDVLRQALARGDNNGAKDLAIQIRDEAEANHCDWQKGMVVQALVLAGMEAEAKALYDKISPRADVNVNARNNVSPSMAVAAALVDEPQTAALLVKEISERDQVNFNLAIAALARRGGGDAAHDLISDLHDASRKAMALSALIVNAPKEEAKKVEWMNELLTLKSGNLQPSEQAIALASLARAEKATANDERWRMSFQFAINAAERTDESLRGPVVSYLASRLVAIKTGRIGLE